MDWREMWQKGQTNWDLGEPHPLLPSLLKVLKLEQLLQEGMRVYVPGCGAGHDAASLAQAGHGVLGEDIVEEAISAARKLYHNHPQLRLRVGDVFTHAEERFDLVFDRAMANALPPGKWAEYLEACARRLESGGVFASILITGTSHAPEKGPPYQIEVTDFTACASPWFDLVSAHESGEPALGGVVTNEAVVVLRKH